MPLEADHFLFPPHPQRGDHPPRHGHRAAGPSPHPAGGRLVLRSPGSAAGSGDRGRLRALGVGLSGGYQGTGLRAGRLRRRHRPAAGPDPARHHPLLDGCGGRRLRRCGGQGPGRRPGPEHLQSRPGRPCPAPAAVARQPDPLRPRRRGAAPVLLGGGRGDRRHPPAQHGDARPAGDLSGRYVPGQHRRLHRRGIHPGPAGGRRHPDLAQGHLLAHPGRLSGHGGLPGPGVPPGTGAFELDALQPDGRRRDAGGHLYGHRLRHLPRPAQGPADLWHRLRCADHAPAL